MLRQKLRIAEYNLCLQVLRLFQNRDGRDQSDSIHHHMRDFWIYGPDQQRNSLSGLQHGFQPVLMEGETKMLTFLLLLGWKRAIIYSRYRIDHNHLKKDSDNKIKSGEL